MVLLELRRARITSRVAHLLTPTYFLLSFQYHTIVFELFCFPHASLVFPTILILETYFVERFGNLIPRVKMGPKKIWRG